MGDEDARTLFVGSIPPEVTEDLLYELFLQAGPLVRVNIPKDKDGTRKKFGFVVFKHECSVPYSIDLFNGTKLFGRELLLKRRNTESTQAPAPTQPLPSGCSRMFQGGDERFTRTITTSVSLSGSFSGGSGLLNHQGNGLFTGNFPQFPDRQQFQAPPSDYYSQQRDRFYDSPQGGFDRRRLEEQERYMGRDYNFDDRRFGDGRRESGRERSNYGERNAWESNSGSGERYRRDYYGDQNERHRSDNHGERNYEPRGGREFGRGRNDGYSQQGSRGNRRW